MSAIHNPVSARAPVAHAVPIAIYTRVSTVNQIGGRFDSCESQAAICRDYIHKHADEGWFEAACFSDPAWSGGTMNRPGIRALMRGIEAGEIRIVLIFKLERLLRSTDEWGPFRSFLQKHDCQLVSATEDLSEETPSGRLKNNLLVSVGEYERLNTSAKVRAKLLEQAKRGYWSCGLVPYGYDYDSTSQMLFPHPEEAPVVRRVYAEVARLVSLTAIANTLSAEGIRTRRRTHRRRDGSPRELGGVRFNSFVLGRLIRNPIYAGQIRMNGQCFPGRHEALVSARLWEEANAVINNPVIPPRQQLRNRDKHFHLLKGVLHCGCCQRALIPDASGKPGPDGKPYRYYTCGHVHKERSDSSCPIRRISAPALEAAYIGFLGECCRHPDILDSAVEISRRRSKTERGPRRTDLTAIDQTIADLDRQLRNFAEVVTSGGLDAISDELRERATAAREEKQRKLVERERLCQDLAACEQQGLDIETIRLALERFSRVLPTLEQEQQRDLVTLITARIDIHPRRMPASATSRAFSLRIRLRVPNLVEGMAGHIVVEQPRCGPSGTSPKLLALEAAVAVSNMNAATPIVILTPDHRQLQISRKASPSPLLHGPAGNAHAIHRALAWSRILDDTPGLTRAELARQEGVTPGTLTHYLKLLQLALPIRTFLLSLPSPAGTHPFSLNRMKALADLPPEKQLKKFAIIRQRAARLNPALAEASSPGSK
ncbi:site-specific recombinase, DNA invertase Pin [Opitutaceae bacterium TAV1]|nr:site-specific recombinase, DNA invertase Pin [Opitutaceae bacterium TAV1]